MEVIQALKEQFKEKILEIGSRGNHFFVDIENGELRYLLSFSKKVLNFSYLLGLTLIDNKETLQLVILLRSETKVLEVRSTLPSSLTYLDSFDDLWPNSVLFEEEIREFFGVSFKKNYEPKPFLLPKGWVGFPLKKDYSYPLEIKTETQLIKHKRDENNESTNSSS